MSRSRRAPEPTPTPVTRRRLRDIAWLRLLAKITVCAVLSVALRLGLGFALQRLFAAWNLSMDTLPRAPGWARVFYLWHGSLISLVVSAFIVALILGPLRVPLPRPHVKETGLWWLAGTGVALILALAFLLSDSLRLDRPITAPKLTFGLLALWLLSLLTAMSEDLFLRSLLQDGIPSPWGILAASIAFFLMNGGYSGTVISGVNVALLGAVCGLIYARRGLWADVAFRWGWGFASVFLLGQGGGAHSVYRLYGVSEALLTGGDVGFVYGLGLTVALLALGATMLLKRHNDRQRA